MTNDVLVRIENNYDRLSANHQVIADYVRDHPRDVESFSARKLAEVTHSVPSAIVSFSKRLGYSGYQELKFNFQSFDKDEEEELESRVMRPYRLAQKAANSESFNQVVQIFKQSKRIWIFAYGMSQIVARDFYMKIHKAYPGKVLFFNNFEDQVRNIPLLGDGDAIIMVSNSGECQELIDCLDLFPDGVTRVLVTNGISSTLSRSADVEVSIGCLEESELAFKEFPSDARNAMLYLFDALFKALIDDDYENNLAKIKSSSLFFQRIYSPRRA